MRDPVNVMAGEDPILPFHHLDSGILLLKVFRTFGRRAQKRDGSIPGCSFHTPGGRICASGDRGPVGYDRPPFPQVFMISFRAASR